MADFSNLEKLLGIEEGSTKKLSEEELLPELVKGVNNKTKELSTKLKSNDLQLAEDPNNPLLLENLENQRKQIIEDAKEINEIGKLLLKRFKKDIDDSIVVDAKKWQSAGPMLSSVSNNIKSLHEIINQNIQREEMRQMSAEIHSENTDEMMLSPANIQRIIQEHREKTGKSEEMLQADDAVIIGGTEKPLDLEKLEEETE